MLIHGDRSLKITGNSHSDRTHRHHHYPRHSLLLLLLLLLVLLSQTPAAVITDAMRLQKKLLIARPAYRKHQPAISHRTAARWTWSGFDTATGARHDILPAHHERTVFNTRALASSPAVQMPYPSFVIINSRQIGRQKNEKTAEAKSRLLPRQCRDSLGHRHLEPRWRTGADPPARVLTERLLSHLRNEQFVTDE
jgi:hypothetical protein